MSTWIKIGFRNLLKNRRRSTFTVGAIALGFAAVNLLGGFTSYVFRGLEDSYVYAFGNGHLTVFNEGFQTEGALDPTKYLLDKATIDKITALCAKDPRILVVTPQLNISGLVSNGKVSTIMVAEGKVPSDTAAIRNEGKGLIGRLKMFDGADLSDDTPTGIGLTKGLAAKLKLEINGDAIAMAPTVDGFINALDAEVVQLIDAPIELLDEMMMSVPLSFAQELYDTESADRLTILLAGSHLTYRMKDELQVLFAANGLKTEIQTWDQLRPSYLRIQNMFNVIFSFVFSIVLVIVVLSVVNTISMAVLERTREIGTMRALGMKRRGVVFMFAVESAILGGAGSIVGSAITFAGWAAVKAAKPTWMPPNIPKRVPLEIYLVPEYMTLSLLCRILLAVVAAVFPARRAARMAIIDALGHV